MGVDIQTKLQEEMLGEIDGLASYHGALAQCSRDAILGGESVEPERHSVDDLAYEETWDADIYPDDLRLHWPDTLLHGPVETTNFRNVLVTDERVQLNMHVSKFCSSRFELLICPDIDYLETPLCIVGLDLLHGMHIQISLQVLLLWGDEPNVTAVGVEERDTVHKHVVSG